MKKHSWAALLIVVATASSVSAAPKKKPAAPADPPATTAPATPATDLPAEITAATPPTAELAAGLAGAGRHQDAINIINRLIKLDPVQAHYDRQAALMLRAESHLQLKQVKEAIDTLEAVRLQAVKAVDKKLEVRASAFKFLIEHSPGQTYVPTTGDSKLPIDILASDTRATAYAALFDDQLALLQKKVSDSKASSSISGILEVARVAHDVRCLNVVAHGNARKMSASVKGLPGLAAERMKDALEQIDNTIGQISVSAHRVVHREAGMRVESGHASTVYKDSRAGLTPDESATLQNIVATCDRIPEAVEDLVEALGHPDAYNNRKFKAVPRAAELKHHAEDLLKADYSR